MSETILVVEDEPALRQLIAGALTGAGYCVHQARNGAEAATVFTRHGAAIDLVITDLQMPYVDGPELIETLRERRQSLKVLCISGTQQAPMGADAFIGGCTWWTSTSPWATCSTSSARRRRPTLPRSETLEGAAC